MYHLALDDYVIDVLLPDLVGHDRSPAAFVVYLVIWTQLFRSGGRKVALSLQTLSAQSGLSKSAVQSGIRLLERRSLLKISRRSATAVPEYELARHWLTRRGKHERDAARKR